MEFAKEMMLEKGPVNFIREGVKIGLLNGALAVAIQYISYFSGDIETYFTVKKIAQYTPYFMFILLLYGFHLRNRNGGWMTFKEGLQYTFVSYVIADLMIAISTYFLYNMVDPELTKKTIDYGAIQIEKMIASEQDPERKKSLIESLADYRKTDPHTGIKLILAGFGFELLTDFVKSLVITLVIRREKPAV